MFLITVPNLIKVGMYQVNVLTHTAEIKYPYHQQKKMKKLFLRFQEKQEK
jgi:hypothetical protein